MSLRHRELDADFDGVWLVDAQSGESELLVSVAEAQDLLSAVFPDIPVESIGPVFWSPDGQKLLLWLGNQTTTPVTLWAFWVDLETGETVALPLPAHPNDTGTRRGIWPFQATWSPDGRAILVAANGLHPDDERILLDADNRRVRVSAYLVDVARVTSTLLGHLPVGEAIPFYFASWGADGDVILNGYHLMIE